jgi:hypothetical protein
VAAGVEEAQVPPGGRRPGQQHRGLALDREDVYLVLTGDLRVSTFSIT